MNPTNESIGRAFLSWCSDADSGFSRMIQRIMRDARELDRQATGVYADCCDTPEYCSSVRRCTRQDEAAPQPPAQEQGEDGDWYPSGLGSRVIDLDQDPANQLSILLKDDGTVSAVATRNGSATCGGYGLGEVADVIRSWAAPQPPAQAQGECVHHECRRVRIEMQAEIDRLRAAGAEDARDAARYRWIAANCEVETIKKLAKVEWWYRPDKPLCEKLSVRVDAAIASQAK